ncbi:MAG: extracellular solute-binding protein [Oscillospiraceae bacterium]|jgi:ABC-type glycerol-3-phosphate transport system substrate-binding protein|nr:extracellular solute-binding protein [Oscillospiraceae bacterium]
MKTRIRLFSVAIALCMLITACSSGAPEGGNSSGNGDPTQPSSQTQNPVEKTPTPTPAPTQENPGEVIDAELTAEVSFGNYPPDTAPELELDTFDRWLEILVTQYPNVTPIPDYYSYTLDTYTPRAVGGTAPTIFQPPFTDPQLLISQKLVGDVTDALEEYGLLEKFSPAFVDLLSDENGRIFGMPRDTYVLGLHLNLDLFREAGLMNEDGTPQYPKTLQELAEKGKIIKEKTGKAGLVFPASETFGGWLWTNIAWNFGAVGENALERQIDGRWVVNLTSEPAVAALEYIKSLKWEYDILNADATTTTWASAHTVLGVGEAAMNFAANDSVSNPTATAGLPVESFALVPFPGVEGKDAYALSGGTAYMFAPDVTTDEAVACLALLRIAGLLPFANAEIEAGMRADAASRRDRGVPVILPIPMWNDPEFLALQKAITEEYTNVDQRLYADYFDSMNNGTISLKGEEPVYSQQLYRDVTAAIERVIANEDSDPAALLGMVEANFQKFLDSNVNN